MIFVFGSNLAGIHGAGAAAYAYNHCGAQWHVGEGLTGRAYALPTKDKNLQTRSYPDISVSIARFANCVRLTPRYNFNLTPIGLGLAGLDPAIIAKQLKAEFGPDLRKTNNLFLHPTWLDYVT